MKSDGFNLIICFSKYSLGKKCRCSYSRNNGPLID